MDEIIELLNHVDLKIRERITNMSTIMPGDSTRRQVLANCRLKIQEVLNELMLVNK